MTTYNEKFNWCEDDDLLADFFNRLCGSIAWKAFENQEDWLYMMGELGKGRKPMIKENFYEYFNNLFDNEMAWMRDCVVDGFLKLYYEDDIDIPRSVADEYNLGWDKDSENCIQGRDFDEGKED